MDKDMDRLIKRMPKFMHPDFSLIQNLCDLLFQVAHEVDLGESGETEPRWTAKQLHRAKMYAADVHSKAMQFERDHPELCDDLNHSITVCCLPKSHPGPHMFVDTTRSQPLPGECFASPSEVA